MILTDLFLLSSSFTYLSLHHHLFSWICFTLHLVLFSRFRSLWLIIFLVCRQLRVSRSLCKFFLSTFFMRLLSFCFKLRLNWKKNFYYSISRMFKTDLLYVVLVSVVKWISSFFVTTRVLLDPKTSPCQTDTNTYQFLRQHHQ